MRIKTLFNLDYFVIEFFYKFKEGNLMANLAIELLVLTVVLINFGAINLL